MGIFAKDNLLAWCIVPFDAAGRGPRERAQMLQHLGIGALAYDWREKDIGTFDEELRQLRDHGIELAACWLAGGYPDNEQGARDDPLLGPVLEFVKRNELNIEVWRTCGDGSDEVTADLEQRYEAVAGRIGVLARVFGDLGCRYGLYNHGGWGGEPQTMVELARRLEAEEVGIVYNFHHGHEHLASMPEAFAAMVPYLMCVNLNGMRPGGPQICPLGQGDDDLGILRMIRASGYAGRIGILDHRPEIDAEISLRQNLEGMQRLSGELGDEDALATYR